MNFRRNGDKYLITIEVIALIAVLVLGIVHFVMPGDVIEKKIGSAVHEKQTEETGVADTSNTAATQETSVTPFTPTESVKAKLDAMSTEQKVAQIFITRPEEITGVSTFTQAGKKTKTALEQYTLGGFMFRQENFSGEEATKLMMSNLQSYAQETLGVNIFLAIDEEGGDRTPLAKANGYDAQQAPSTLGSADAAGKSSSAIAGYMSKNGLNMNLAPTADVAYGDNADNDTYAYGSDSATAGDCAAAAISSFNSSGIYSVAKCFPGKGKATTDSTTGMLWMTDKLEDLEATDFTAYKKAIDAGVPALMIGNVLCQSVTGEETTPCSLSSKAVAYVRNTMGFQGVLMTDDLSDTTLNKVCSQDEAAVAAVKAGMSMIYVSSGFEGSYNAVLSAVNSGEISAEQLDDAVGRVLTTKGI